MTTFIRKCSIPLGDRILVPHYVQAGLSEPPFQGIVVTARWYEPKEFRHEAAHKPAMYRLTIIPDDNHCLECYYDEDEVIMLDKRLTKEEMLTHWDVRVRQLGLINANA